MTKKKINRHNLRPIWCWDKDCQVVYTSFNPQHFNDGYSCFCFGKLKKPHLFIEKKATHKNELSHCYYTPLKGVIRFFVTIGDLWGEIQAKLSVMNKLQPLGQCYKCKKQLYRMVKSCFKISKQKSICYECKNEEELSEMFNLAIDIIPKKIPKSQIHKVWQEIQKRLEVNQDI